MPGFHGGDARASVPEPLPAFGVPPVTKTPDGKLAGTGKNAISPPRCFCVSRPGRALGSGPDSPDRTLHFNNISAEPRAFAFERRRRGHFCHFSERRRPTFLIAHSHLPIRCLFSYKRASSTALKCHTRLESLNQH